MELSKNGVKSVYIAPRPNNNPPAMCIFEYVYFARPDSIFEGKNYLLMSLYVALTNTLTLAITFLPEEIGISY